MPTHIYHAPHTTDSRRPQWPVGRLLTVNRWRVPWLSDLRYMDSMPSGASDAWRYRDRMEQSFNILIGIVFATSDLGSWRCGLFSWMNTVFSLTPPYLNAPLMSGRPSSHLPNHCRLSHRRIDAATYCPEIPCRRPLVFSPPRHSHPLVPRSSIVPLYRDDRQTL